MWRHKSLTHQKIMLFYSHGIALWIVANNTQNYHNLHGSFEQLDQVHPIFHLQ